jgi:hypothetical protein
VVAVQSEPEFRFGSPTPVQRRFGLAPPQNPRPYDMLPDGRLISVDAAIMAAEQRNPQLLVVLNWFEELTAKLPAPK